MIYKKGNTYQGHFQNGKREGKIKIGLNINNDNIKDFYGNYENDILKNGKIYYKNGDEFDGKCDENGIRKGLGRIKYKKNGKIYHGNWENDKKNGEGFLCLNINDFQIYNININEIKKNFKNIFKIDFNNNFSYGNFKNDYKDGTLIVYMKKSKIHELFNNTIWVINYNNGIKNDMCIIYLNNEEFLEIYWEKGKIAPKKEGIFYLYGKIQYTKKNNNLEEWANFIIEKRERYKIEGNIKKNTFKKTNER